MSVLKLDIRGQYTVVFVIYSKLVRNWLVSYQDSLMVKSCLTNIFNRTTLMQGKWLCTVSLCIFIVITVVTSIFFVFQMTFSFSKNWWSWCLTSTKLTPWVMSSRKELDLKLSLFHLSLRDCLMEEPRYVCVVSKFVLYFLFSSISALYLYCR